MDIGQKIVGWSSERGELVRHKVELGIGISPSEKRAGTGCHDRQ